MSDQTSSLQHVTDADALLAQLGLLWRVGLAGETALLAAQAEPVHLPPPCATPQEIAPPPVTASRPQFGESLTEHTTQFAPPTE